MKKSEPINPLNYFTKKELINLSFSRPTLAQLELTRNCNQSCLFCFRSCEKNKLYEDLDIRKWEIILDKLFNLGVYILNLSGGEIYLYRQLEEFLSKAHGRFKIAITTNGTLPMNKYLKYIDQIDFSIHDIGKNHDGIVNLKGAFEKAENNLSEALKTKIKVGINTVLIKRNFYHINKIYKYFDRRFPKLHHHSFTFSINASSGKNFKGETLKLNKKSLDYYINSINQIPREKRKYKHGLSAMIGEGYHEGNSKVSLPDCAGGKYKLTVAYNGDVYPCRYFLGKDYYCGNLLEMDALEMWKNGKGFKPFRDYYENIKKIDKKCQSCQKLDRCYGGCRAYTKSYLLNGDFSYERDQKCVIRPSFARTGDNNQMQS